jgi:DNA-binding protein HU-beta
MNKNTFAKELAKRLNCTNVTIKAFIREYNNLIADKINEGYNIKLQYFGVFSPSSRKEHEGRNPKTGDKCKISKRTTIKFKPSKYILEKMNQK